jgi:hypothetical protein
MSRFVSGGTVDQPTQRDAEWLQAQDKIEAARRNKEDERNQNGGKSLFEVLQANKGVSSCYSVLATWPLTNLEYCRRKTRGL